MLQQLLNHPHLTGARRRPDMHRLPAVLLTYCLAAAAVAKDDIGLVLRVMKNVELRADGMLLDTVYSDTQYDDALRKEWMESLHTPGQGQKFKLAASHWVREKVAPHVRQFSATERDLETLLDEAEYLLALCSAMHPRAHEQHGWFPLGYFYRGFPWTAQDMPTRGHAAAHYQRRLEAEGSEFPLIKDGPIESVDTFREVKDWVDNQVRDRTRMW